MCALLFLAWTAEWPLAADPLLYNGHWRSPFLAFGPLFVSVPGINLFPWQLLLIALAPLCLLWPGAFRKRAWPMDAAIVTSFAAVTLTFLWGWTRGGSPYNAYYQLWRFLVALLVGLLLLSVVRSSRDLKAVGFTLLLAALVRGTLCIYFYWEVVHGKIEPPPPYMTSHCDSLLFVAGILISLSWALARGTATAWLGAVFVSAHLVYAIVLNDRRLAWIELLLVGVTLFLLPRRRARRRNRLRVPLVAAPLLIYAIVGWGREEAVFEPLRALATISGNEDSSTLARQEEVRNLLYTMWAAGNPILGTGWGVPYQKVTSVYANFGPEWWQYAYLPHNSLLAVAVFGGLVGISGIWLVVPVAAFLARRGYRGSARPTDRAAAMAALCVLPAYGAQCYGDIGFQSLTGGLILGVAMAAAGKTAAWAGSLPEAARRGPGPWRAGPSVRAGTPRAWREAEPPAATVLTPGGP
jgi:hypothetical protein